MIIRRYRATDLEAVAALFTASVHTLTVAYYDQAQRSAWAPPLPDLQAWAERLGRLETLVAEQDGRLPGFLSYESSGHIDLLYTAPAHARRGVASELLRAAEIRLAGSGVKELVTEASQLAMHFFSKQGFVVSEELTVMRQGVAFRRYAMKKTLA